jgi:hypothetical protein
MCLVSRSYDQGFGLHSGHQTVFRPTTLNGSSFDSKYHLMLCNFASGSPLESSGKVLFAYAKPLRNNDSFVCG